MTCIGMRLKLKWFLYSIAQLKLRVHRELEYILKFVFGIFIFKIVYTYFQ